MSGQFKKPFSNPEEQPPKASPSSSISDLNTLQSPAINLPPAPNAMPPQGYVQGQHGQYGSRQTGQLFPEAGGSGQSGNTPANQLFAGQPGNMPVSQPF